MLLYQKNRSSEDGREEGKENRKDIEGRKSVSFIKPSAWGLKLGTNRIYWKSYILLTKKQ